VRGLLATGLCLALLAGCSGGDEEVGGNDARSSSPAPLTLPADPTSEGSSSPSTTASSPAAPTNARGNVEADLGEPIAVEGSDGRPAVVFAIDDVVVGLECTGRDAAPPGEAYFIGVRIRVTTGDLSTLGGTWGMSPNDWGIAGADGSTNFDVVDEAAATCLDAPEKFPTDPLRSDQEVSGTFVLNSPTPSGTVLFSTPAVPGRGWEWKF
jgi:hypothetical protein